MKTKIIFISLALAFGLFLLASPSKAQLSGQTDCFDTRAVVTYGSSCPSGYKNDGCANTECSAICCVEDTTPTFPTSGSCPGTCYTACPNSYERYSAGDDECSEDGAFCCVEESAGDGECGGGEGECYLKSETCPNGEVSDSNPCGNASEYKCCKLSSGGGSGGSSGSSGGSSGAAGGSWTEGIDLIGSVTDLPETDSESLLEGILLWILRVFITLAFIFFVIAGIMYLLAGPDKNMAEKAKTATFYSIVAVVVALISYIIIKLIFDLLWGGAGQ